MNTDTGEQDTGAAIPTNTKRPPRENKNYKKVLSLRAIILDPWQALPPVSTSIKSTRSSDMEKPHR